MSRSFKDGLDYFSFDVYMDDKFELLEAEFGLTGFAVVVKLYQRIYRFGYYCELKDEVALLFAREVGLGGNVVSEILSCCFKRGIFNQELFDKYGILTSSGIQKRYFEATKRRKGVTAIRDYLLVNVSILDINVNIIDLNVDINEINVGNNKQSKVKESKGKYSIVPPSKKEFEEDDTIDMEKINNVLYGRNRNGGN